MQTNSSKTGLDGRYSNGKQRVVTGDAREKPSVSGCVGSERTSWLPYKLPVGLFAAILGGFIGEHLTRSE